MARHGLEIIMAFTVSHYFIVSKIALNYLISAIARFLADKLS